MRIPTKFDAVLSLVGGNLSGRSDGLEIDYIDGQTQPTDAEITQEIARLQSEYDSQEYSRSRQQEYPSIQECIHAILDDDLTALQEKRQAVKDKYQVDTLETADGTGSIIVNNNLSLEATSSTEGGEIKFIGSGTNADWQIDEYDGVLRIHTAGTVPFTITGDGRGLSDFTAKAWVNFNGSGTVAIRDSHNVSSVSDNGTGAYTVNFDNNLADTSYSFHYCGGDTGGAETTFQLGSISLVSSNRVQLKNAAGTVTDRPYITGLYFGD